MTNLVEKLRKNSWKNRWESSGKVSTFLTEYMFYDDKLWNMFGFSQGFWQLSTIFSTELLFGFTEVREVDFHFYT